MLVKLNYTSPTNPVTLFRTISYIISNTSITSISGLYSSLIAAGASSSFNLSYLDLTNSYVVRTNAASNCSAHIARPTAASGGYAFEFTLRQPIHDASGTYVYHQWYNSSTTANADTCTISSSISSWGGSEWSVTISNTGSSGQGTTLTQTGTQVQNGTMYPSSTSNLTYTFWFYLTDYSVMWAYNQDLTAGLGISTTTFGGTSAGWTGIRFASQYRRFDYWNTSANNIVPIAYGNSNRTTSMVFTTTNDYNSVNNPTSATATESMFSVMHQVTDAQPSTNLTWTISNNQRVSWGLGTRFSDCLAMTSSSTTAGTTATGPNIGQVLWVDAGNINTRLPISNLQNRGYALLPFTWRNAKYGAMGGNISEIGDLYLFNGDYFPGDEFVYNNRTFVLLPTAQSWTTRLAIAVPKE